MKIIFAGTPDFAAVALREVAAAGHEVVLVLTQPDRPGGRGMALQASPVKKVAVAQGWPVYQPATLREVPAQEPLHKVGAEAMLVVAYGLILPQAVLDIPPLGCFNIHASLLPRWRGAAPIQRAILSGDDETGVCFMQMEAGLDSGPVLARARTPIRADDTGGSLHDRLAEMGAVLAVETLAQLPLVPQEQSTEGVTYAAKIDKSEAVIDWRKTAMELDRCVRAFNPFPGVQTRMGGVGVKIWEARPVEGGVAPAGEILSVSKSGITVACGEGALCIKELQKAGGKRLSAAQFLSGHPLTKGEIFTD